MIYKDKDFFKMTQLTFSLALYLRLPAQMPLHRVPDTFPHRDGEVAEFPVVAGEGFQLVYEAGHKMLGDDTNYLPHYRGEFHQVAAELNEKS